MTVWQRRMKQMVVVAALAAAAVLGAIGIGAQGSPGVNPGLFSGVYYRPLTVFSRGGRVTAVAGVPSNQQVYYMGSAGGVFKTTDAGVTWVPVTDGQIGVGSIGAIGRRRLESRTSSTSARAPANRAATSPTATASTSPPTPARPGSTSASRRPASSAASASIRPIPTSCSWRPSATASARTRNAASTARRTAARRGSRCSRSARTPARSTSRCDSEEPEHDLRRPCGPCAASRGRSTPAAWTAASFRSTDGGDHWTKLTQRPADGRDGRQDRRLDFAAPTPKRVYALIEAADDQGGVFRSDDGGETWTRTNARRNLLQRAFYYTHIFADPVERGHRLRHQHGRLQVHRRRQDVARPIAHGPRRQPRLVDQPARTTRR